MLTWEDCLGVAGVTEELVALELTNYMVHEPDGVPRLKRMILDDIAAAQTRGDVDHANHLRRVLLHFVALHRDD